MATDMIARAIAMSKASLVDGKVPASELPSYVDDVVEYASAASFPATGEQSKIYIALDTNTSYRWSGSTYIPITGQSDWNQTDTTAPDYINNKPTLGTAASHDVASEIGDTTDIPTAAQVNTALGGKQDSLSPAQQAAVDSGINTTKVTQYDKDSAALPSVVDGGAKNKLPENSFTETGKWKQISCELEPGDYVVSIGSLSSTDTDAVTCQFGVFDSGDNTLSTRQVSRGSNVSREFTITSKSSYIRFYSSDTAAHGDGDTITAADAMICSKAAWDVSQKYVPYCPSMGEMYEMIKALQT